MPSAHTNSRDAAALEKSAMTGTDVNRDASSASNATLYAPNPRPKTAIAIETDDPLHPIHWSLGKKLLCIIGLCVNVLSLTYGSTAYVSSMKSLEPVYHIGQEVALLGVSLFVLGFAAGPLLFGPLSELYGRRVIYAATGVAYSAFSFGAAFANNATSLLIFRFLAGFFGSSSINNVPASVGDVTTPEYRGAFTLPYALCAFGGPSLGPLISSFIQVRSSWQWNIRIIAIFSTLSALLAALVPETHAPTLAKWKAAKEGMEAPKVTFTMVVAKLKIALSRPIAMFFTEPICFSICVYLSFLYGILYGFFEGFGIVWIQTRHFSEESYGLTYIALGLGFLAGGIVLATAQQAYYLHHLRNAYAQGEKHCLPEARLGQAYLGAILCPISLFLFAWTAPFPSIHWFVPCLAEAMFSASMLMIFTAFIPYMVDVYQSTAASALAAGMASRAAVGAAFPLFSLQMYDKLTIQGANSLLAGLAVLLAPIPFAFRIYGPSIRERSRFIQN